MGKIGLGYGSEWHMLRFLGYHRNYLNQLISQETGINNIEWLDFPFSAINEPLKRTKEWKGLDFLEDSNVIYDWKKYWPQTGNTQNWDAIGRCDINGMQTWLLVEAKAHLGECLSSSDPKPASLGGGRETILVALKSTMKYMNVPEIISPNNWMSPYYQYANRLAVLNFLNEKGIDARFLFFGFTGDKNRSKKCPNNEQEWIKKVDDIHQHLGINKDSPLMNQVHHLFVSVNG